MTPSRRDGAATESKLPELDDFADIMRLSGEEGASALLIETQPLGLSIGSEGAARAWPPLAPLLSAAVPELAIRPSTALRESLGAVIEQTAVQIPLKEPRYGIRAAPLGDRSLLRPGTAVFMTTSAEGIPHSLLHNLKHNKVLHERVILLTVKIEDLPYVPADERTEINDLERGFWRMIVRYGFMDEIDIPAALARVEACGPKFRMMDTSFFLARQTLITSPTPGMAVWREKLFAWMLRNAESAMEFFRLPPNRVVELGAQVEI